MVELRKSSRVCFFLLLGCLAASAEPEPRELYNEGTQKFQQGKFSEAETALQGAVASQNAKIQSPALYNLGHLRFQVGEKELKEGPNGKAAQGSAQRASGNADAAIQSADQALSGSDMDALVAAYLQGRGARKDLKGAMEAVRRAMESNKSVLQKWERASGDFKSANELRPSDTDSKANAEVVDRHIAKLVDLQKMLMQMMAMMGQEKQDLDQRMKKMKAKMQGGDPGKQFKGGDEEDDEEGDDKPTPESKAQEKEGPSKNGKERLMTPEEAEGLLGMLKLDANRKLPIGEEGDTKRPKDRKNRDW